MGTISKSRELSYDEIQAFGAELDALRKETIAKLGKEDADYIYKIRNFVRYSEIGSRAALMTLGW
ncbi:MAG TPA: acyl-CoA desaturase, partial [Fluviicoccus sp.]|nr:acyl-CoA desaturase [Fluviicoccus sp.]